MALNLYPDQVEVLRIGDSLNEKLIIPKEYKNKIIEIKKYCTKPELEILLIIAEDMNKEFQKVKSTIKPKKFAKENIKYGKHKYDNSTVFYHEYFENRVEFLANTIKKYKQLQGAHKKDELYLADLLK